MVQVFQGAQFLRILFRFKEQFWLTSQLPSNNLYEEDLLNYIKHFHLQPKQIRTLTYDMIRNSKTSQLTVVAVFLVDVGGQIKAGGIPLDSQSESINAYKSLITSDLSSPRVFAEEGSSVKLVTN